VASGSASGTGKTARRGDGSMRRPAGSEPRPAARAGRTTSAGPVLLVVSLLALLGIGGGFLIREGGLPIGTGKVERPRDPGRVYKVADAIDRRQMLPVWNLLNLAGLEQRCRGARAFTVTHEVEGPAAVPTRFVVYCRDQGFWVVEADPSRERWGTLGPFATHEQVEAVIDSEGEFLWGSRPPGQRGFVGGLAGGR